jgi:hypothetical protein
VTPMGDQKGSPMEVDYNRRPFDVVKNFYIFPASENIWKTTKKYLRYKLWEMDYGQQNLEIILFHIFLWTVEDSYCIYILLAYGTSNPAVRQFKILH